MEQMPEPANAQTQILEREIKHLSDDFTRHADNLERRFTGIADEQKHQWEEIKESQRLLTDLRLKVVSLAAYATIGSVVGAAVTVSAINIVVPRLFS